MLTTVNGPAFNRNPPAGAIGSIPDLYARHLPAPQPEIALRSFSADGAASSAHCTQPPSWHAPAQLIRPARITRPELAARNRCARFQAIVVGVLRRSEPAVQIGNAPGAIWLALLLAVLLTAPARVTAQWLNYPTPGIPRVASGAPDMTAPAPRTTDGRPDFSGMWFANVPSRDFCREKDCIQEERMAREQINIGINLKGGLPYTEWSQEQMTIRRANGGREDPHTYCMPPNFPRGWTLPQHIRVVQTPSMMVLLHEFNGAYREIYLDGRPLPVNPNPTWNGYSTGRWEGDTLVIETNGIRDDMWLDIQGSPITESARVTERLRRVNFGLMQVEIAVNDPKAYTRPWSVTIEMAAIVDTQMLEEVCMDNEKDTRLYTK